MDTSIKKVILATPRGFCAGVDRAIEVVEDCLQLFGKPIYVKHQIVHNKHVVKRLEDLGAITVESPNEVPEGATIVFSAHGSPPEQYAQAQSRNLRIIDATCPLVTKVHLEVHRYHKEGYQIVYIGHPGHVEGIGVRGELNPGQIPIVETPEEVRALEIGNPEKLIYLTQTTLSIDDTRAVILALKQKYPQISEPPKEDICYATTNRQEAVKALAKVCDAVLVVGSKNSSNSNRLVDTARSCGVPAYLIDDKSDINPELIQDTKIIGVTSGASAPDHLVQEIVDHFTRQGAIREELVLKREEIHFPEPIELRNHKKQATNNKQ